MSESKLISVSPAQPSPHAIDDLPESSEKVDLLAACEVFECRKRDGTPERNEWADIRAVAKEMADNAYRTALKGLARAEFKKNADNPSSNVTLVFPQSVIPWKSKSDDTDLILGKAFALVAKTAGEKITVDAVYRNGNSWLSSLIGTMFVRVSSDQQAEVITDYAKAQTGIYPKPKGCDCE